MQITNLVSVQVNFQKLQYCSRKIGFHFYGAASSDVGVAGGVVVVAVVAGGGVVVAVAVVVAVVAGDGVVVAVALIVVITFTALRKKNSAPI